VYPPLKYLALGAVAAGAVPIILKAIVSIRNVRFDINILVIIAGNFFICINSFS
jgi:Cd2+/Zn2+-exporting ATPase